MTVPIFPGSLVPRANITVSGAQTPFWTSLASLPLVYPVVELARSVKGAFRATEAKERTDKA